MHEKFKDIVKQFGVKKAGRRVAGRGQVAWRKTLREDFFSAKGEQAQAFHRRFCGAPVSTWPWRSAHDEPFNSSSLASREVLGGHFPLHTDSGKQNERVPIVTRGCFWESWAPSLLNDLKYLRVDCLLSRLVSHLGVDVSLELEAALPVGSQSAPPSARVESVGDKSGRVTLCDRGCLFFARHVCALSWWPFTSSLFTGCRRIVSLCGWFPRCEQHSDVRCHQSVLFGNGSRPAGDPELIEDVSLHSFACNFDDHPVTRRDESNITAVETAAVHHELEVDSLLWFGAFFDGETVAFVGCR